MTTTQGSDVSRHIRGSSLLLFGRLLAMVIALFTQVIVVNVLEKAEYGVFAFGLTLVSSFRVLVSFGDSQSVGRFLTLDMEADDRTGFDSTLALVLAKILAGSALLIAGLAVGANLLTDTFLSETSDSTVVVIVILLAPLEAIGAVFGAVFAVFGKVRMVLLRKYLYAPLFRLIVVAVLAFGGYSTRVLAAGYVLGEVIGLLFYAAVAKRTIGELGAPSEKTSVRGEVRSRFKPYMLYSMPAGTIEMVSIVMTTVTVLFLGWWHGAEAVAEFRSIFPFGRLNQMVLLTFSVLFAPLATRYFARSDRSGMETAYWQTSAYLMVLSFPIFTLSVPLAWQTVPTLFGDEYTAAAPALAVLGTAYYLHSAFGYNALVLQVHGLVRWVMLANFSAMVAVVVVGLIVIPSTGAVGVSWSVLAGLGVQNLVNQVGLQRHLGFRWVHPIIVRMASASGVLSIGLGLLAWAGVPLVGLVPAAGVATVILLVTARQSLDLGATFPELGRLPLIGKLLA